ncbi:hypothetical protein ACJJTC_003634, partial [Scirpophaga incertulas]
MYQSYLKKFIKYLLNYSMLLLGKPVAGVLMSYSRGCAAVLSQMSEGERNRDRQRDRETATTDTPRSPTDSSSDGYHSDSDDSQQLPDSRSKVVSQYGAVWALAAAEALPALAALAPLAQSPHLKYKIVFSIAVLSFRAAISLRDRRLSEVRALLGAGDDVTSGSGGTSDVTSGDNDVTAAAARLTDAATQLMRRTAHAYPLGEAERTVVSQVLSTLREYSCLGTCGALHSLVAAACRAAWAVCLASPPLRIDTDFTP